jgi:hypothetical protein
MLNDYLIFKTYKPCFENLFNDFSNTKRDMLMLGASKHWSEALHALTNVREVNAAPLLEYFKPLTDWLKNENSKYNV